MGVFINQVELHQNRVWLQRRKRRYRFRAVPATTGYFV